MKARFTILLVLIALACNIPRVPLSTTPPPVTTTVISRPTANSTPSPQPAKPTLQWTPTVVARPKIDDFFARCPSAAEIASVNHDLKLTFETDPTKGTLACKAADGSADLTPLQKRAYQSVLIMRTLQFDSPLPWTDKQLYSWFVNTIKGIRFSKNFQYSHCCDPANVIDIKLADNSYLMLTDKWVDPSLGGGLQDTMVLYVHEARHNEGFPHTCSNGADDKTIAEKGAWGVQYYLLQWLAQHVTSGFLDAPGSDPHAYREIALNDAISIRTSRFCNEPTVTPGLGPTLSP